MNEQILKLVNSAAIGKADFDNGSYYVATPDKIEKFAELIVRECALVVFKKTGPKSALDVLEHFGVEE